ncbi:uncharacterized protein [Centruroides vittatus]|uniref:uncharacterized protein n=1 Tax=Centruroides vittatus TaxID=120091 RepID=UPI00350F1062
MFKLWIQQTRHLLLHVHRKAICIFIILCIVTVISLIHQWNFKSQHILQHLYFNYNLDIEEPVNPNQTCVLPRIHPFDNSIWPYITSSRPIKCRTGVGYFTFVDKAGLLQYNHTAIVNANYKNIRCSYQYIVRKLDNDDQIEYSEKQNLPPEGITLSSDFVLVTCSNFYGVDIYSAIHTHVRNIDTKRSSNHSFNVLIFGLDSMSRLSFIRLLPNTYQYLKDNMKSFIFRGMNKVGDNTFPNLIAMLTGKEAYGNELPSESKFDEWPCIWNNYSQNNYLTLFIEDFPKFGLFNYLAPGFKNPPTDYYFRPFWLAAENSKINHMSSHLCFGPTPKHIVQMNYLEDFIVKYNQNNYFAFSFLAEISHEYLSKVASADQDFVNMLKMFYENNLLARTIFIFMSDHGHRFDAIRKTPVGRVEERMPFFSIFVPAILANEQPQAIKNLQANTAKLITHYDTYSTLMDILQYSVKRTMLGHSYSKFGISLFSNIPLNRTCEAAGIPDHYCTCGKEIPLTVDLPEIRQAADVIVTKINELLSELERNTHSCAILTLSQVISASRLLSHPSVSSANIDYTLSIMLETNPSKGLFESTVRLSKDGSFQILGDISRINEYGNQSSCIQHTILRKYCYCVNIELI